MSSSLVFPEINELKTFYICLLQNYGILGCIRKSIASRSSEVNLPIYSALVFSNLEFCVRFRTTQDTGDRELLKQVEQRTVKGLENLPCVKRLRV